MLLFMDADKRINILTETVSVKIFGLAKLKNLQKIRELFGRLNGKYFNIFRSFYWAQPELSYNLIAI